MLSIGSWNGGKRCIVKPQFYHRLININKSSIPTAFHQRYSEMMLNKRTYGRTCCSYEHFYKSPCNTVRESDPERKKSVLRWCYHDSSSQQPGIRRGAEIHRLRRADNHRADIWTMQIPRPNFTHPHSEAQRWCWESPVFRKHISDLEAGGGWTHFEKHCM